jgi:uncharacterized protein YcbK (DUF882 family)
METKAGIELRNGNGDSRSLLGEGDFRSRDTSFQETSSLIRRSVSAAWALVSKRGVISRRGVISTGVAALAVAGLCFFGVARLSHAAGRVPTASRSRLRAEERGTAAGSSVYELHLHHLHTGESLDVVYRVGDTYIPSAIASLNHFLRDHRTQDEAHYDPREFDVLHDVLLKLHRPAAEIDVVCGYRTPWSNGFLRTRGGTVAPSETGVAEHSQHMLSKAIDIKVPGVSTARLRDAALSLHAGGVGYYPVSQFVHVDVGPVRQWSFR